MTPSQQQPQQQNVNLFAQLNQSAPQQHTQTPGKKPGDVWSEGSGLFDLSNLKAGDKSRLETAQTGFNINANNGTNLLSDSNDLDKIWTQAQGGVSQTSTSVGSNANGFS